MIILKKILNFLTLFLLLILAGCSNTILLNYGDVKLNYDDVKLMPGYGYIEIKFQKFNDIYFRNKPIAYMVSFYKNPSIEIQNAKLENNILKLYVPYYKEQELYGVTLIFFSTIDDSTQFLDIDIVKNPDEARNIVHKNHETYENKLFYKDIFITPYFNTNEFFFTNRRMRASVGS